MILVGLTGGVATGKTTVARMFEKCGALLIDADQLARDVVQPSTPAWRAVVKAFGKGILNPDRTVNRTALGRIVFRHRDKRLLLERIIHPRVARRQACIVKAAVGMNPRAVIVYEVPLLFEAGVDKRVDQVIVVTADRETQIRRLKTRNGFTQGEALRRIKSQFPLAKKATLADVVLNGTAPPPVLRRQVRRLYRTLRQLA